MLIDAFPNHLTDASEAFKRSVMLDMPLYQNLIPGRGQMSVLESSVLHFIVFVAFVPHPHQKNVITLFPVAVCSMLHTH